MAEPEVNPISRFSFFVKASILGLSQHAFVGVMFPICGVIFLLLGWAFSEQMAVLLGGTFILGGLCVFFRVARDVSRLKSPLGTDTRRTTDAK